MLQGIRTAAGNWLGRIVLSILFGVLILSFAIWGIGDIFRGYGSSAAATVGSVEIPAETLRRAYTDEVQRMSQMARRNITNEQARAAGIDRLVLQRTIADTVLDNRVRSLGIAVRPEYVAKEVAADPGFSRASFNEYLRQQGYANDAAFFRDQARVTARRMLVEGISGGQLPPAIWLDAQHRFRTEERSIEAFTLPAASVGEVAAPEEAVLQAFFENRKAGYRSSEYRKISLLLLQPKDYVSDVTVSEEEIKAAYEAALKSGAIGVPEKRALQQIPFPDEAQANAAAERLKAGLTFEALAAERKLSEQDLALGTKSRAELFDPAIAQAAFDLDEGGISLPVKGQFATVILRVTKTEPGTAPNFEWERARLQQELTQRKLTGDRTVRDKVSDLHDKIEDQRASGKALAEIARDLSVSFPQIAATDARGRDKAGALVLEMPEAPDVLRAAFASEVGVDTEVIRTKDQGYIWFELNGVEVPRDRPFEEVRTELLAAWKAEETSKKLAARSADLAKKIRDGASFASVAAEVGATVETVAGMTRGKPGTLGAAVVTGVFSVPQGSVADAAAANTTDRVVFRVTGVAVPPRSPALDETARQRLESDMLEDTLTEYVTRARNDLGVKINERAVRLATGAAEN
jgi:peptidyl-prolyl cis-trans isomerase D